MASYHLSVKVGVKGKALPHASYIVREGDYKTRKGEKLEAVEHGNMPEWAKQNPSLFWQCSDEFERKNGSTYREIEIALPRELTEEQRKSMVQAFVKQELGEQHAYTWAIHNPRASIEGGEQPHAHIMYSERIQDSVSRSPDQFFRRYNSKQPEKGGCRKSNTAKTAQERKNELIGLRERFATLQNRYLEHYEHQSRVDHRSHADRGLKQAPERHLGWKQANNPSIQEKIKEYREAQQSYDAHIQYLPSFIQELTEKYSKEHDLEKIRQTIVKSEKIIKQSDDLYAQYQSEYTESYIKRQLNAYYDQAEQVREKLKEHDKNEPLLFGKKDWEQKRKAIVDHHEQISYEHKKLKEQTSVSLRWNKDFGREEVLQKMQDLHPDLMKKLPRAKAVMKAVRKAELQVQQQKRQPIKQRDRER